MTYSSIVYPSFTETVKPNNNNEESYLIAPSIQHERKYIKDGVKFISSKEQFVNMGVDLVQLSVFVKQIGILFDSNFEENISNLYEANKNIVIKIKIQSNLPISYPEKNKCKTDCHQMKISFHSYDDLGKNLSHFTKQVRSLPKIGISNTLKSDTVEFNIYLNTKPKGFIPKQPPTKYKPLEIQPFDSLA